MLIELHPLIEVEKSTYRSIELQQRWNEMRGNCLVSNTSGLYTLLPSETVGCHAPWITLALFHVLSISRLQSISSWLIASFTPFVIVWRAPQVYICSGWSIFLGSASLLFCGANGTLLSPLSSPSLHLSVQLKRPINNRAPSPGLPPPLMCFWREGEWERGSIVAPTNPTMHHCPRAKTGGWDAYWSVQMFSRFSQCEELLLYLHFHSIILYNPDLWT